MLQLKKTLEKDGKELEIAATYNGETDTVWLQSVVAWHFPESVDITEIVKSTTGLQDFFEDIFTDEDIKNAASEIEKPGYVMPPFYEPPSNFNKLKGNE